MFLMIHILCMELKKVILSENVFNFNNYFFSTGTPTTQILDDGMPVTYFPGLQVPIIELKTNSMTAHR